MKKSRLSERPLLKNDHLEALKLIGDVSFKTHKLNFLDDFSMHVCSKCSFSKSSKNMKTRLESGFLFEGGVA